MSECVQKRRDILKQSIQNENKTQYCLSKAKAFPETREFHEFMPLSKECIEKNRYDEQYSSIYNFNNQANSLVIPMSH